MFGLTGPTLTADRRARFEADRRVLAELHPDIRHYIWAATGDAFAEGSMDVDIGAGCFEAVAVRLDFGPRYPEVPPTVRETAGRWRPSMDRHILAGGEFCLWLLHVDVPDVRRVSGLREFLLRLLLFLRDQFVYDDLGQWPGLDWPHGQVDAYARHVVERLGLRDLASFRQLWPLVVGARDQAARTCPCGSGRVYYRCHLGDIEALQWIRHHEKRGAIATRIEENLRAP